MFKDGYVISKTPLSKNIDGYFDPNTRVFSIVNNHKKTITIELSGEFNIFLEFPCYVDDNKQLTINTSSTTTLITGDLFSLLISLINEQNAKIIELQNRINIILTQI